MQTSKVFIVMCALIGATTAISNDFFSGVQTGVFIQSEEAFKDYSCPMPQKLEYIQQAETMVAPMKQMFMSMNKGESNPLVDSIESVISQFSIVISLFLGDYDAGDFCKGLIFAKMVSTILMKVFGSFYTKIFDPTQSGEVNPALQSLMGAAMQN